MLYVEDICIANYFIILKISQYPCERTEIWRFEKELKLFRQSDYLNQQEYEDDLLSLDLQLHSEDTNGKRKYEKYTIPLHVISPQIKCKTYVKSILHYISAYHYLASTLTAVKWFYIKWRKNVTTWIYVSVYSRKNCSVNIVGFPIVQK